MHFERQDRAFEIARQHVVPGEVSFVVAPRNPNGPAEFEGTDRIVIDQRRGAFQVDHEDSLNRSQFWVRDGETTWTPNARGDVIPLLGGSDRIPGLAPKLLDPSWLVAYDLSDVTPEECNGRNALRVHAHFTAGRVMVLPEVEPTEVEVLIDAEFGFLHRMTGLVDDQPYHVLELVDLVLDPVLSPDTFRIDGSARVISEAEMRRWLKPSLPMRVRVRLTRPFRRPGRGSR
jgi:hypothetical protein